MDIKINFTVNGKQKTVTTDPQRPLLEVIREDLRITGPKLGCGQGQCGSCTVLMDGQRTLSCITPVSSADKKSIITIEGLAKDDMLHPVQQAFVEEGAMQCGFCTGGMILAATALLERNPNPTDEQITEGMNGNICRCNGYVKIHKAIRRASEIIRRR